MRKKLSALLLGGALAVALLSGCGGTAERETLADTAEDAVPVSAQAETVDASETLIEFADGAVTANGISADTDDGELILDEGGIYRLTGTGAARIVADTADNEEITLILDGCDFTCADGEVIYIKTAHAAKVVLAEGSENVLTSGNAASSADTAGEDASGAALRFKCPLTITGTGALAVYGYVNNGIGGSGDLTIDGGVITVTAVNDGVKSKANVTVNDGVLTIDANADGIQADGELTVSGGALDIVTGSGAEDADMKVSDSLMMGNMGGFPGMPWDKDDEDSVSRKGLKAGTAITVTGGSIALDTEDDAIHSDGDVTIMGGELRIASGDDGVHGDTALTISGGTVDVQYCYEGLEANSILIEGGFVNIIATDDGMNVNGGNGMFGFGGPSGEASGESDDSEDTEGTTPVLRITGGVVVVDSGGDGLDSNGSIYIEGGEIYVSGPSSDWDAAIDYGEGSAEFVITGGTVMAGGYSGMAEAPDATDGAQPAIYYVLDGYAEDGALCTLTDADGNVLLSYEFIHGYNCVVLSSPELAVGETYTFTAGDQTAQIELTDTIFSNRARSGRGGFPGMPGGGSGEASNG